MPMKHIRLTRWVLCTVLSVALILTLLVGCGKKADADEEPKIKYATEGVTAVEDPDAFQKAVDNMYDKASQPGIGLEYKNSASSSDGTNFACYIANAAENTYDMFITIFGDAELTEQLYLSDLLRPGQAFSTLELEKKLDKGTHTVYVAFTQVEEDLETIHAQVIVTMDFTVK